MPKHPKAVEAEAKLAGLRETQAILQPPRTEAPAPVRQPEPAPASVTAAPAPADPPRTEAAPAQVDPEKHPDYWKTRFLSTDGVIRQERDRHEAALAAERSRVAAFEKTAADEKAALEAQLNEMREKLKTPPKPPDPSEFYSEEMILEQGPENMQKMIDGMTKLVERRVNEGVAAATAPLKQELNSLKAATVSTQRTEDQRSRASFMSAVSTAIPGWEQWATTETSGVEFKTYLAARIPHTDMTRQQALNSAWNARDSVRVVEILQSFLDGMGEPVATQSQDARQIPSGRDAGGDPQPAAGPMMYLDEVEQFRKDYAHGLYAKRPKDAAEMMNKMKRAAGTPGGIGRR